MLVMVMSVIAIVDIVAQTSTAGEKSKVAQKSYKIVLVSAQSSNPYFFTINAGAQDEAKTLGVSVVFQAPQANNIQSQLTVVQAIQATKPDFVIIAPVDSTGMIAPLRMMKEDNIPVITVDRDVLDTSVRLGTIISNNKKGGYMAAEYLSKALGGSGDVAYLGFTPGIQSVDDRHTGWNDGLKEFKGLRLAGEAFETSDLQSLTAKANALLTRNPNLKGIFASFTNAVLAAASAVKNAGLSGKVKVVGFDASPDEIQALRSGAIDALIAQEAYTMGQLAVRYAVDYLDNGTKPPDTTYTSFIVITPENVNSPDIVPYIYRGAK